MIDRASYPTLSLASGIVGGVLLLASGAKVLLGGGYAPPVLLLPSLAAAGLAIGFGLPVVRDPQARAGVMLGRGAAVAGLVLGLVYVTTALVIPLLLILLFLLFGWPWYYGTCYADCAPPRASGRGCCDGCCDGCCNGCGGANACSCGNACDCGSGCGSCGSGGCGGCGCVGFHAQSLAHHPDEPRYDADVYRVAGLRLCVGCFTTHPVFVLASALLLLAPLAWATSLALGIALASMQLVSSAGLARWRALKATVKACLGAGLALLVHGTLASPYAAGAKWAVLLAALALALASTLPRSWRMRRAALKRVA